MCNPRIRIHDFLVLEFGNLELASFVAKILKALRKLWEKRLHPSPSISCESNLRVIRVELFIFFNAIFFFDTEASTNLNRPLFRYVGGKIARVEVGDVRTYEENKLRRLDLLSNVLRTQLPDVSLRNGLQVI